MGRACGYRILLQTAKLWGRGPHFASDGHILLQMTASRFRRPHFASDGRILLRTIAFRFRWPRFASDSRILLWTAAFCFGGQHFASHGRDCLWITTQSFKEKHFALCIARCALTLQKDVMDPYYNEMCLFARGGCYSTFSPRVSHFFERPYVMYFHELCQTYNQN